MKHSLIRYRESVKKLKSLPSRGNRALLESNYFLKFTLRCNFMKFPLRCDSMLYKSNELIMLPMADRVHTRPLRRRTICSTRKLSPKRCVLKSRKTKKPINPERIKVAQLRQELKILKQENKKWKNILKVCDELDVKPEDFNDQIPAEVKELYLPPMKQESAEVNRRNKKYVNIIDGVVDNIIINGPCIATRNTGQNKKEQKPTPNVLTLEDDSFCKNLDKYLDSLLESLSD